MRKILINMNITMRLRLRLVKCFVWSVLMYGYEAWILDKRMKKRTDSMDMWILRRMIRIPWTARVTKERVMEMTVVGKDLKGVVMSRQLKFLGHLLRHDCLGKDVLLGKMEGGRARGRQRIEFATSLMEDVQGEVTVVGLVQLAHDRNRWRFMVVQVNEDAALR